MDVAGCKVDGREPSVRMAGQLSSAVVTGADGAGIFANRDGVSLAHAFFPSLGATRIIAVADSDGIGPCDRRRGIGGRSG